MAEILSLTERAAKELTEQQSFRSRGVAQALGEIAEQNERGEVRSLVALIVDYNGRVSTSLSREREDDVVMLGALEIFKSDLLAKIRETREFVTESDDGSGNDK